MALTSKKKIYLNDSSIKGNIYLNDKVNSILRKTITELTYDDLKGCTGITDNILTGCNYLTHIELPNTITPNVKVFYDCYNLSDIIIEDNDKYISNGTCIVDNDTKTLIIGGVNTIIPNDTKIIGFNAFRLRNITNINIPDSVISIKDNAFFKCTLLKSVSIGNGIETIGINAFYFYNPSPELEYNTYNNGSYFGNSLNPYVVLMEYDSSSDTIEINENTRIIYSGALYGNSNITDITLPDSIISIGDSAFRNCSNLTSITLPDGLKHIDSFAFGGCSSLKDLVFPSSVEAPFDSICFNCSSLRNITLPGFNTGTAFRNKYPIKSIFFGYDDTTGGIPDSLRTITILNAETVPDNAFKDCSKLSDINLPEGITSIGVDAFNGCSTSLYVKIPDSVTSIGARAFKNACRPSKLPASITYIGDDAFYRTNISNSEITFSGTTAQLNRAIGNRKIAGASSSGVLNTITFICSDGNETVN